MLDAAQLVVVLVSGLLAAKFTSTSVRHSTILVQIQFLGY